MEFLTLKEVAKLIGVSRSTIYNVISAPDFPEPTVLSKRRLWFKGAVLKWKKDKRGYFQRGFKEANLN